MYWSVEFSVFRLQSKSTLYTVQTTLKSEHSTTTRDGSEKRDQTSESTVHTLFQLPQTAHRVPHRTGLTCVGCRSLVRLQGPVVSVAALRSRAGVAAFTARFRSADSTPVSASPTPSPRHPRMGLNPFPTLVAWWLVPSDASHTYVTVRHGTDTPSGQGDRGAQRLAWELGGRRGSPPAGDFSLEP